jgi:hypothetical protein
MEDFLQFVNWTLHLWDQSTGQVRKLAAAPVGIKRGPVPFPVLAHGKASWLAASEADFAELHLLDLGTARDRIIASERLGSAAFVWPLLIWPAAESDTSPTVLHAYDVAGEVVVELPKPLKDVQNPSTVIAGRDGQLAWGSADYRTLWVGARPWLLL